MRRNCDSCYADVSPRLSFRDSADEGADLPGSLAIAHPLPMTPLFALVGGGRNPVFPPNKVILWLESVGSETEGKVGNGRAVASIEYG